MAAPEHSIFCSTTVRAITVSSEIAGNPFLTLIMSAVPDLSCVLQSTRYTFPNMMDRIALKRKHSIKRKKDSEVSADRGTS